MADQTQNPDFLSGYQPAAEFELPQSNYRSDKPWENPAAYSESPYFKWTQANPDLAHIPKERVLEHMHKELAPELEPERFNALVDQRNGWQAIQKAKENLSPVEKFRQAYPKFNDIPRERIINSMYKHAVAQKQVDPNLVNPEEFAHQVDPLPDGANDLWNAWEGVKTMASASLHDFNAGVMGGYQKWGEDMFFKFLDNLDTRVDIDTQSGKVTVVPSSAGTDLQKKIEKSTEKLRDKFDKWIANANPGFFDVVKKVREFMQTGAGLTQEAQEAAKQRDLERSGMAEGPYGEAGKIAGQVGASLILQFPLGGALQKGFEATKALEAFDAATQAQALMNKTAALGAATAMTATKYHEAIEAHHENAFGEALLTGFTAPMQGYLFNSALGRVQLGLTNALLDASPQVIQDMIDGKPTDLSQLASQVGLDIGLGALIKGKPAEGLRETSIAPAEFESHRALTAADILGGEEEGYPSKVPGLSPLRIVPKKETQISINQSLLTQSLKNEGPAGEDVLAKGRPLTRQQPVPGEGGIRLISNQVRANVPTLDEAIHDTSGLAEALDVPNLLEPTTNVRKRVTAVQVPLSKQRVTYSFQVWDEVEKALAAREEGDMPKAQNHVDNAAMLMTDTEREQFKKDSVEGVQAAPTSPEKGKTYDREAMDKRYGITRARRMNQSGAITIPNPIPKIKQLYEDYFRDVLGPVLPKSDNYKEAAALIRKPATQGMSDAVIKDHMTVHAALNPWGYRSQQFRNAWNVFNNATLKQFIIDRSNGVRPISPKPKHQGTVDYFFDTYDEILAGAAATRAHLKFDPQGFYPRSLVMDLPGRPFLKKFDRELLAWQKRTGSTGMPPLSEVFKWKVPFSTYNPEDWLQAELHQTRMPLKKIEVLHAFENAGKAIRTDGNFIGPPPPTWKVTEAPNGEKFYVEPETRAVIDRYFDAHSLYDIPVLRHAFGGARNLKSASANILSWSLFHYKHMFSISISNAFAELMDGAPFDKAFGTMAKSGYRLQAPGTKTATGKTVINPVRLSNDRILDYFKEKLPKAQMTPDELRWIDFYERAGMSMGINSERQMQLQFVRGLGELFKKVQPFAFGADRAASLALHLAQLEWLQTQMFGEWIPRIKSQAFRLGVERLLSKDPTLEQPQNYIKFSKELKTLGDNIDDRFGERNMENLLWPRMVKEAGTSILLSLGWTTGFVNVTGGAVKDLFNSTAHAAAVATRLKKPGDYQYITNRMKFFATYTTSLVMQGALMSLFYGWSQGKKFEKKDLVYPVIGKDDTYPVDDPRHWVRGRPGEFQVELLTLAAHINQHGGLTPLGAAYGGEDFFSNKIQPGLRNFYDAFAVQRDFFGKDIGGNILEPEAQRIADKLGYMLYNDTIPITVKQEIEPRVGHPAPKTFQEYVKNVASPDALPLIIGFPRAPQNVYRTGFENQVVNAFNQKGNKIKTQQVIDKSTWLNEYRRALEVGDEERGDKALDVLTKQFDVSKGTLSRIQHEVGQLQALEEESGTHIDGGVLYMFQHGGFTPAEQRVLLNKATPEERKVYEQFIKEEPDKESE